MVSVPRTTTNLRSLLFAPLVAATTALGLLGASCAGSGFTYVKSPDNNAFFRIPDDWTLFDQEQIINHSGNLSPQAAQAAQSGQWLEAFDGNPDPSLDNLLDPTSGHPTGFAKVRPLTPQEHQTFSLISLRNSVIPVDDLSEKEPGSVEVLTTEDLLLPGGFRGTRIVFNVRQADRFLTVNQTGLVDAATRKLYLFLIACEANCYIKNRSLIDNIVSSWTIKER